MGKDNFFGDITFGEALETSVKQAINHAKGKKILRSQIRSNIPEITKFKGNEIKEIRLSINCTQKMFSKIMGVSVSTVEYWESGKNIPNGSAQRLLSLIKVKKEKFIEEDLMKLNV
jgi:putative transcriptional regulator